MVDSGAGVSACPVDYAPDCEVKRGSVNLPLVGATAGPMVTIFMATFCGRGAVAATQCSKGAVACLAAFLMG